MTGAADEYLAHMGIEVPDDIKEAESFAHYGKKGMKWGVRNDERGGAARRKAEKAEGEKSTQKERNAAYKKDPTAREYFLGTGKTFSERAASRQTAGVMAATAILGGAAAKIAVNTIPQLSQYKAGVREAATTLQVAGLGVAVYSEVAGRVDWMSSKP